MNRILGIIILFFLSCNNNQTIEYQKDDINKLIIQNAQLNKFNENAEPLIIYDSLFINEGFNFVFENRINNPIRKAGTNYSNNQIDYYTNNFDQITVLGLYVNILHGDTIVNGSFLTKPLNNILFSHNELVEISFANMGFHPDSSFIIRFLNFGEYNSVFNDFFF